MKKEQKTEKRQLNTMTKEHLTMTKEQISVMLTRSPIAARTHPQPALRRSMAKDQDVRKSQKTKPLRRAHLWCARLGIENQRLLGQGQVLFADSP
jgi:hypothetical protein